MAEEHKLVHSAEPATVTTVRKRGRPRKDESRVSDSASRKYQKADQGSHAASIPIGQPVSGVLDGKFDAGYMLTVRVGNAGTVLRGVVFEPGRVVPVSSTNDIAPHLTMVPRAEVPIPGSTEIQSQTPPVKNKTTNPITPLPGTYSVSGDKGGAPALTGTFVVPVTLSSMVPKQSPPVETVKIKTDNQPSPMVSAQSRKSEYESKNILTAAESKVIPQSGSADIAGPSSTSDSMNVDHVQKAEDKKPNTAAPAIVESGMAQQAGETTSMHENKASSTTDTSKNDDSEPTSADVDRKSG